MKNSIIIGDHMETSTGIRSSIPLLTTAQQYIVENHGDNGSEANCVDENA